MEFFRNRSKSFFFALMLLTLESCMVYTPIKAPYYEDIYKLKKGDMIDLTTTNGAHIGKIRVQEVWRDSLLLGSSKHATKVSEIAKIKIRKVSPGLTILAIAIPAVLLGVLISESLNFSPFPKGIFKI